MAKKKISRRSTSHKKIHPVQKHLQKHFPTFFAKPWFAVSMLALCLVAFALYIVAQHSANAYMCAGEPYGFSGKVKVVTSKNTSTFYYGYYNRDCRSITWYRIPAHSGVCPVFPRTNRYTVAWDHATCPKGLTCLWNANYGCPSGYKPSPYGRCSFGGSEKDIYYARICQKV